MKNNHENLEWEVGYPSIHNNYLVKIVHKGERVKSTKNCPTCIPHKYRLLFECDQVVDIRCDA